MGIPAIDTGPFEIADYLAFTDARPDDERWELIEGVPVLNASPLPMHQRILSNLDFFFGRLSRASAVAWEAFPGVGVLVSDHDLPEPDFLVRPSTPWQGDARVCSDPIVLFEILSPSTAKQDLQWKRSAYSSLPSVMHYVVIAQDAAEVVVFSRRTSFKEERLRGLSSTVNLDAIAVILPLSDIYDRLDIR